MRVFGLSLALAWLAGTAAAPAQSVYLIGNSLTWDTVPGRLDGDVQWHVDCGKPLTFIEAHPEMPCVKTSTLWPTALKEKQYAIISVQPHYEESVEAVAAVIGRWAEMQPNAVFVIHTGWAHHENRVGEFAAPAATGKLVHSDIHYQTLLKTLQQRYPTRTFKMTRAMSLLQRVADDIAAGKAPLKQITELYRDAIHMTHDGGRYLMHNAMRHALGQPRSAVGFEMLAPPLKTYLDTVLDTLDQPAN